MNACTDLDDDQLLAASRCRGWTVGDVIVHVHLGLQDMLFGLVAPTNAEPDTDAASYWRAGVPTNDSDAGKVTAVRSYVSSEPLTVDPPGSSTTSALPPKASRRQ